MRCPKYILFLLATIGTLFAASACEAQVTATATVRLTVVPAPGMNFIPSTSPAFLSDSKNVAPDAPTGAMAFKSPGNVLVQLNSANSVTSKFDLREGEVKTFTERQLHDATSIEIDYLGS